MSLVDVLKEYDCLKVNQPTEKGEIVTEKGEIVAALRGENELWLALALNSGELDNLLPEHLATVCLCSSQRK